MADQSQSVRPYRCGDRRVPISWNWTKRARRSLAMRSCGSNESSNCSPILPTRMPGHNSWPALAPMPSRGISRRSIWNAPPSDPLHDFVAAADGEFCHREMDDQDVFMVRRPEMIGIARSVATLWESRVRESGALRLENWAACRRSKISFDRRPPWHAAGFRTASRNYIACSSTELTRLVLGHSDPAEAIDQGRLGIDASRPGMGQSSSSRVYDLGSPRGTIWPAKWLDCNDQPNSS